MKFAHIGIAVKDVQVSAKFYCEVLGLHKDSELNTPRIKFVNLSLNGYEVELLQHTDDVEKNRGIGVIDHIALEVMDIDAEVKKLQALNVKFVFDTPMEVAGGQKINFFFGPDGERIELVQKRVKEPSLDSF